MAQKSNTDKGGGEIEKSRSQTIKDTLLSKGALQLFKDNLPRATGAHADEAARRFAKMVYTAICQSDKLMNCSAGSIVKAASISASLNLDIDVRGLAYLVPYKNNVGTKQSPRYVMEAQFQIGYLGLIELAYRSGKVQSIAAHCIYESEKNKVEINRVDGQFSVKHPFSFTPPTGNMIAVYASAVIEGLGAQTLVLRKSEVEKFRKMSKSPDSPAWKNHYDAMAKKTAIRQLGKFLPKSILQDFSRAAALDEYEPFIDVLRAAKVIKADETGSKVIDTNFEEQMTPTLPPESPEKKPDEPSEEKPPKTKKKKKKAKSKPKDEPEAEQKSGDRKLPGFMKDDDG